MRVIYFECLKLNCCSASLPYQDFYLFVSPRLKTWKRFDGILSCTKVFTFECSEEKLNSVIYEISKVLQSLNSQFGN